MTIEFAQFSLLLLAIPVLFQTPADLMQAWPIWKEAGTIDTQQAMRYLASIGGAVASALVIVVSGFLLLRALLRRLPRILQGEPPAE